MHCPTCKVKMHTVAMDTVTIDECPQCGGIWFDRGEFDDVLESTDPDLAWLDVGFWKNHNDFKVSTDDLTCPKCKQLYLTRLEDPTTSTAAASCSNCRGIWLDTDQLHRIIEAIADIAHRMDVADYMKASLHRFARMIDTSPEKPAFQWRELQAVLRMLKYRIYTEHPQLMSLIVGAQKSLPL